MSLSATSRVTIEGYYDPTTGLTTYSAPITASSSSPLATYTVTNPSITGLYVFSIANVAGVAATNNFISLFNPIGSGKTLTFGGAFISSTTAGGSTATDPMRGYRITTASSGTLQADSASAKFLTSMADPVAEVRIGNPSVTLGAAVFNSPPAISATTGSTAVHAVTNPPGAGPFTFVPGEGVVLQTAAGDTDQRWNLSIVWGEI